MGRVLRAKRVGAGLSQEALAERAGLTANHVQNLEKGAMAPTITTLERLGEALGVKGSELLLDAEVNLSRID